MKPHILTRLDTGDIPTSPQEVRVFCLVYNEMLRLPSFLKYYRDMGVSRFFFSDNNSNDGTREYLLTQLDCHVFHTPNSYNEARSGIRWTKALLDLYGTGHWALTLDADEILVYPHSETVSLPQFCTFLEKEGSETFFTFLLDMYPKGNIADAILSPGQSMFEVASYFDKDYRYVDRTRLRGPAPFPPKEMLGGPRTRCFYPGQDKLSYRQRWMIHFYRRLTANLEMLSIPIKKISTQSPALFKVPLIKWKKEYEYLASTHRIKALPLSAVTGAIGHFKFLSDFHARVVASVEKGEHAEGGAEYKRYLARMDAIGSLMYEGSTHYSSTQDLLTHDLIKTSPEYEEYVASLGKSST